jgi:hypothetical protein
MDYELAKQLKDAGYPISLMSKGCENCWGDLHQGCTSDCKTIESLIPRQLAAGSPNRNGGSPEGAVLPLVKGGVQYPDREAGVRRG